jgi:hypothetical protein
VSGPALAFVFVVAEYNHSMPAVIKNAVDFLFAEWHLKPAGFISYGLAGGVRAVEHLRLVLTEVKALPTGSQVSLSVFDDFTYEHPNDPFGSSTVTARDHQAGALAPSGPQMLWIVDGSDTTFQTSGRGASIVVSTPIVTFGDVAAEEAGEPDRGVLVLGTPTRLITPPGRTMP